MFEPTNAPTATGNAPSSSGDAQTASSSKPPLEERIAKRVNELKAQITYYENMCDEKLEMEERLVEYPTYLEEKLTQKLDVNFEEIETKARDNVNKLLSSFDEKSRAEYEQEKKREEELKMLTSQKEKLENNLYERQLLINEYTAKFADLDRRWAEHMQRKQRFEELAAMEF